MQYYLRNAYIGRVLATLAVDTAALACASWLTWLLLQPAFDPSLYSLATLFGAPVTAVALAYCDAYRPAVIGSLQRTLPCIGNTMGLAFAVSMMIYFFLPVPPGTIEALAQVGTFYFPILLLGRSVLRVMVTFAPFKRRVIVIGASDLGLAIAEALHSNRNAGIDLVGFLSDEYDIPGAKINGFPIIGYVHEVEKVIKAQKIDHIVVASKNREEFFPSDALQAAKMRGCRAESGVSFYERVSGRIYLRDLRASYLIFSDGFYMGPVSTAIKRAIDIVGASLGIMLTLPALLVCAVAIRLDSKGPIFYRQIRGGRDDRSFLLNKLRSMRVDAEHETGAVFTSQDDERITRVGHFMRKTRLDEFPQLWNILLGDMSLVGPRPERPEFADELSERHTFYRLRSTVKPGLTGWAQVRYGYVNDVDAYEEKLALDLYYLKHRSLMMDVMILWQTVKTVLLFRGM